MQYTTEKETGTKQTNDINFCKTACTLSKDLDQPANPHSLISLCYLDEEAAYLVEYVVKTDQTV